MLSELQKVRIKATGVIGEVVDISEISGVTHYVIESDKRSPDGTWELYDCIESEITPV